MTLFLKHCIELLFIQLLKLNKYRNSHVGDTNMVVNVTAEIKYQL